MLREDVRYAWRGLRANRGFTAAAIVSLALGIGATTSIYSVASALLLRPLPYADADRLVILWNRSPGLGITEDWFSTAQYFDIKSSSQTFEEVAIAIGANYNLTGDGEPERVGTIRVSSNLLPMLGVRAEVGRLFGAADDVTGAPGVALLGHGTWRRRYGGDHAVVGRSIILNGQSYTIVGVLPASFDLPREVLPTLGGAEHAEILLPLPLAADAATVRNREDYNLLAKLKRGATLEQSQAELDALTARLRGDHPQIYPPTGGLTFSSVPLHEQVVGDVRRPLGVLIAAVACVLLIACLNVANLLIVRALGRRNEIAVRAALGASRRRLVRQLLTESVLLATGGAALGLGLAVLGDRAMHLLGSHSIPRLDSVAINSEVLLFTIAVSVLTALVFGLIPAVRLSALDLQQHLKDASRGASGARSLWAGGRNGRRMLITSEIALSVVLLIAAGLLIRSLAQLQSVAPGFNAANVLTLELTMTGRKYTDAAVAFEAYRSLWQRLTALPGVDAAGAVSALPLSQMMAWGPIVVEGRTPAAGEAFINADIRIVAHDYFRAMQIPLIDGRLFTEQDLRTTPRVIVIDAQMASQLWPGESAIGKRIRTGGMDASANAPWLTVVGVVGRIKQDRLDAESRIAVYHPHAQVPTRAMNVVVRSAIDPGSLTSSVRRAIHEIDPDLPIYNIRSMDDRVAASLAERRFAMLLLTLFAVIAVSLSAVGIYGVLAFVVNQGTRELGIRLALGDTPHGLAMLVVRHAAAVVVVGTVLGLAGAVALVRSMESLLFGISTRDPLTFAAVPVLLAVVALAASVLPARRAARVDPVTALRCE
jgi:predicted permease